MPRIDHRAKTLPEALKGQDIYRLLVEEVVDQINELRRELRLPERTMAQVLQSLRQRRKAQQQRDG